MNQSPEISQEVAEVAKKTAAAEESARPQIAPRSLWTQGEDLEDLKAHLRDLYEMFSTEDIPGIRKVAEVNLFR